ncbi:MAG: hypothetical protein JNL21_04785 [Myxococcales bacterium]|nr:hypothetical protein [Myxococcales bacterium]
MRVPPLLPGLVAASVPVGPSPESAQEPCRLGTSAPDPRGLDWTSDAAPAGEVVPRAERRGILLVAIATGLLAGVIGFGALTSTVHRSSVLTSGGVGELPRLEVVMAVRGPLPGQTPGPTRGSTEARPDPRRRVGRGPRPIVEG